MQKALEADGEKLRQLTGEDHGPYFIMAKDWKVNIVDTGGPGTGWPYVSSELEDRIVLSSEGFHHVLPGHGPSMKEAKEICQLVADYMNAKG
jgi:hypothetical protein